MVLVAGMAASFQPWYRISLPPRAWKGFRFGSMAFRAWAVFVSASFKASSSLKDLGSQPDFSYTMLEKYPTPNRDIRLPPDAGPVIQSPQPPGPSSPPG